MINTRLAWYLEYNNLISPVQSSFRSERSTNDNLVRLETFIRDAFVKKEHVVAVFFDLEKAYDTTWKYGILRDLHEFGVKGRLANNLSSKLREHGRHAMLSFLSSLPIPVLSILDIEANRFYDRNHQMYEAALLTICYTQHALRPFIDAVINHQRHFIKIPFINKGMDFIDLPSIFQDKSVTSFNLITSKILSHL